MSKISPIHPEDILPDETNNFFKDGQNHRKGSVAAFIANIKILEDINTAEEDKPSVIDALKQLAPTLIAVGLHEHAIFKNPLVEQILVDEQNLIDKKTS